jgi:hypothetical protein
MSERMVACPGSRQHSYKRDKEGKLCKLLALDKGLGLRARASPPWWKTLYLPLQVAAKPFPSNVHSHLIPRSVPTKWSLQASATMCLHVPQCFRALLPSHRLLSSASLSGGSLLGWPRTDASRGHKICTLAALLWTPSFLVRGVRMEVVP